MTLSVESYDPTLVETCAAMLPDIEHLVVSAEPKTYEVNLSHIWGCWPSLLSLEAFCHGMNCLNFNSILCGYSPAEMKMLQKKSVRKLEKSMIVPSSPSVTGMTSKGMNFLSSVLTCLYILVAKCLCLLNMKKTKIAWTVLVHAERGGPTQGRLSVCT